MTTDSEIGLGYKFDLNIFKKLGIEKKDKSIYILLCIKTLKERNLEITVENLLEIIKDFNSDLEMQARIAAHISWENPSKKGGNKNYTAKNKRINKRRYSKSNRYKNKKNKTIKKYIKKRKSKTKKNI